MNAFKTYVDAMSQVLDTAYSTQQNAIQTAAMELARRISQGGVIHLFGTGHSHMMAEEGFFRAGGLACVNAMLEPNLMLHHGAEESSWLEKVEGFASVILDKYRVQSTDVLITISNSGRNAVPIEAAIEAKSRGLYTIGITSMKNYKGESSRHSSGQKLGDVVNLVIDNCGVIGDAITPMRNGLSMGATSTVVGAALINGLLVQTAENLIEMGQEPPIIQSANVDTPGAVEKNAKLIEHYGARVRFF